MIGKDGGARRRELKVESMAKKSPSIKGLGFDNASMAIAAPYKPSKDDLQYRAIGGQELEEIKAKPKSCAECDAKFDYAQAGRFMYGQYYCPQCSDKFWSYSTYLDLVVMRYINSLPLECPIKSKRGIISNLKIGKVECSINIFDLWEIVKQGAEGDFNYKELTAYLTDLLMPLAIAAGLTQTVNR